MKNLLAILLFIACLVAAAVIVRGQDRVGITAGYGGDTGDSGNGSSLAGKLLTEKNIGKGFALVVEAEASKDLKLYRDQRGTALRDVNLLRYYALRRLFFIQGGVSIAGIYFSSTPRAASAESYTKWAVQPVLGLGVSHQLANHGLIVADFKAKLKADLKAKSDLPIYQGKTITDGFVSSEVGSLQVWLPVRKHSHWNYLIEGNVGVSDYRRNEAWYGVGLGGLHRAKFFAISVGVGYIR